MFVGLNPSKGHFPSGADRMFYRLLRSRDFSNAHLTDAVKVKATAREVAMVFADAELMRLSRGYLSEEVEILRPRLIVALGKKAYTLVRRWLPEFPSERVKLVHHYSWAYRWRRKRQFGQEMNRIRDSLG